VLRYVYGQDQVVAQFVGELIPHVGGRGFGPAAKAIGIIDEDGILIAGLVYANYDPGSETIELSGAAIHPRWLTRETIARMYQYPFLQCGCQMIYQKTPADNERLLRQLAEYDYTFIKVPRMFGRERDGVLCLLTVEDWRNNRFNKRFKHHVIDAVPQEEAA